MTVKVDFGFKLFGDSWKWKRSCKSATFSKKNIDIGSLKKKLTKETTFSRK